MSPTTLRRLWKPYASLLNVIEIKCSVSRIARTVHLQRKCYTLKKIVIAAWGLAKYVHKFLLSFLKNYNQLEPNYWISCWSCSAKPTAFNWFELFKSNSLTKSCNGDWKRFAIHSVVFRARALWGGILACWNKSWLKHGCAADRSNQPPAGMTNSSVLV